MYMHPCCRKSSMDAHRDVPHAERTVEANWQHEMRSSILKGHMPMRDLPRMLPTCAKVFLSCVYSGKIKLLYLPACYNLINNCSLSIASTLPEYRLPASVSPK